MQLRILLIGCLALSMGGQLRAEVFVLASGGKVEGELLNPDELPRSRYVIRLAEGGELTLSAQQVRQVLTRNPIVVEYERIRHHHADTVEAQWALAEWCRENFLTTQRKVHLERIVELDPDHAPARRALGYSRFDGQWKTQSQAMSDRGYVYHKGKWMLPQEIELANRNRQQELAEKEWYANLKRWRQWLNGDRQTEAVAELNRIRDPAALPALKQYLGDEPVDDVRKLYLHAAARIGTPAAVELLAARSVEDPAEENRLTCLDFLEEKPHPAVVSLLISKLKDKENEIVNRAAVGLQRMGDASAVGPLIDALVTSHKHTISTGNPNGYSATFSPDGSVGGGLSAGGGARVINYQLRNPHVLDALIALSGGVNFSYDARLWRVWHAAQKKSDTLDARRN